MFGIVKLSEDVWVNMDNVRYFRDYPRNGGSEAMGEVVDPVLLLIVGDAPDLGLGKTHTISLYRRARENALRWLEHNASDYTASAPVQLGDDRQIRGSDETPS